MRQYVITGAGGHLGGALLRLLAPTGTEVRGLLLPGETPPITGKNLHYFYGDITRPETLEPLFQNSGGNEIIVLHGAGLISISQKVSPILREVNVEGTRNMIRVSLAHTVRRFVYVSSVHAIPEPPLGTPITETDQFSPEWVTGAYAKTKAEATQAVLDSVQKGLSAVVVHPSGIIGPYDSGRNHLVQLFRDYLSGRLSACVKGGYDFVDVRDAARGCLLAAEQGKPGECYILSGHSASVYDLLAQGGARLGKKPPRIVPLPLARAATPFIEAIARARKKRPLYTSYSLRTLQSNSAFSHEKATRLLGYRPRALERTIDDMTTWYLDDPPPVHRAVKRKGYTTA